MRFVIKANYIEVHIGNLPPEEMKTILAESLATLGYDATEPEWIRRNVMYPGAGESEPSLPPVLRIKLRDGSDLNECAASLKLCLKHYHSIDVIVPSVRPM